MKQKQLLWLAGALVLLLVIAWMAGVFDREISTVRIPQISVPADEVSTIALRFEQGEMQFEKRGQAWVFAESEADTVDSSGVQNLLEDLSEMELSTVVSTNAERYGHYGVDSTGTQVTLTWDASTRYFVIGERGPDYASNYVRVDGDDRVFLTRTSINVPTDRQRWRSH